MIKSFLLQELCKPLARRIGSVAAGIAMTAPTITQGQVESVEASVTALVLIALDLSLSAGNRHSAALLHGIKKMAGLK